MSQDMQTLLRQLYDESIIPPLIDKIEARLENTCITSSRKETWSAEDILLITYADAIQTDNESALCTLGRFLDERLPGLISQVHLLPFYPHTSDDGFAVSDYRTVDPAHGNWSDIEALSANYELVFDLVINHASSAHAHFQDFLNDRAPGNQYFITATADQDLSNVTRPRATELLQDYPTAAGNKLVWCTFSRDQVDWNFSNPDVLYEFIDILITYVERGARWLRIDAVAYLWKTVGTPCVHLPQTHAVVKLLRLIADRVSSDIRLLTETNVPLEENLSYFGNGDEAHIVYNFPLPPLVVHALVTGRSDMLTQWCQSLPELPPGCIYLNMTASHDGIGLRPAEGLLDEIELEKLLTCVRRFDGKLTQRKRADGSLSPYEANISLLDALRGTVDGEDEWQVERFLVSQCLMMSLAGVPAIYYNSILAAPNNLTGLQETGRNRTINRKKWTLEDIEERLADPEGAPQRILNGLKEMIAVRKAQPAFHPEAAQQCISAGERVFALIRRSTTDGQTMVCLFNLSQSEVCVDKVALSLTAKQRLEPQFIQGSVEHTTAQITLSPYAIGWLKKID